MMAIGWLSLLIMGLVLGLLGGGGAILTVPILVYLFGQAPSAATGDSLFVVGVTALVGAVAAHRRREVEVPLAVSFAVPSVVGVSIARAAVVPRLPEMLFRIGELPFQKDLLIMICFASLMVAASLAMLRPRTEATAHVEPRRGWSVWIGLAVGFAAGFVGAGGGFLIVPALVQFGRLSVRRAIGTSLLIIAVQSLIGFLADWQVRQTIHPITLVGMSALPIVGMMAGQRLSHRVPELQLKRAFGWFVLATGFLILAQQLYGFLTLEVT